MNALKISFVRHYRIVIRAAGGSVGDCRYRRRPGDIDMLGVVSGAYSVVDSIAIDIWARWAGLPF